jgi:hypothetical protein
VAWHLMDKRGIKVTSFAGPYKRKIDNSYLDPTLHRVYPVTWCLPPTVTSGLPPVRKNPRLIQLLLSMTIESLMIATFNS